MRKSGGLKHGLNLRKPTKPVTESVFSISMGRPNQFVGSSETREAQKLAQTLQQEDPSVYGYDEFHDHITQARQHQKQKDKSMKPKYMEKLMETAQRRQIEQQVVKEKLLAKEREREGDMYEDKETFVTEGYREQKEQRQEMVREEEERERREEKQQKGTMGVGFYREFLDHVDSQDLGKVKVDGKVEKREKKELGAGLNVVASSRLIRQSQNKPASTSSQRPTSRIQRRSNYSHQLEDQLIAQQHDSESKEEEERNRMIRHFARRNDAAAVEAARQRYLERCKLI